MDKKILFLDGLMIPASKSLTEALSPEMLSGKGVFETMRVYEGKIFALDRHLERLLGGLSTLKIDAPFSKGKMEEYLYRSLKENKLKDARVRLTVWKAGERSKMSIVVLPYVPYSRVKYKEGFKVVISDIRRDETKKATRIKSINYLPLALAFRRAKARGHDEAILLNRKGDLAEGSRTNIFFIKDGALFTPSLSCGCLPGITRQIVLEMAQKLNMPYKEIKASPIELARADEAFLTNSLIEVMPLTCLQGRLIGKGEIGPVTSRILKAYRKLVSSQGL